MSKLYNLETAKEFLEIVPRTVPENIAFRLELHKLLSKDDSFQKLFWQWAREDLQVLFDVCFTTLNPRMPWGQQNRPFILRPKQIEAVHLIDSRIRGSLDNQGKPCDVGIRKTRDEGASEIVAKIYAAWCILYEYVSFILGSDKKEDVDFIGDDYTLFAKVDNVFHNLPSWMGFQYNKNIQRKDMLLRVLDNNSAIRGETTNENFSAGKRATSMVLDEFGRIRKSIADSIEGTVHAVTDCVIYSSTHWLGPGHTFNVCLNKDTTQTVDLLWFQNPEKARGMYKSPEPGLVEIIDVDYYNKNIPELIQYLDNHNKFKKDLLPEELQSMFIADGAKDPIIKCRSPWHDWKEKQSAGNRRDFVSNTWGEPYGSSESVFDQEVLHIIKNDFVRPPDFEGEIIFDYSEDDEVIDVDFIHNYGQRRFKWWGELINNRPNQKHNFIIGADPGQGQGSSNSVSYIYDVNTHELCGEWVCPNTKPEQFADIVVALAKWCGGVIDTFLIWERNGGHGANFTDRIEYQGYTNCYKMTVEDTITRKRKKKWGFYSNQDRKAALLGDFGVALGYGIESNFNYKAAIIYSLDLVDELFDYTFVEGSKEITTSKKADLSSGARERHGDRGIAAALCVLGCKDQTAGDFRETKEAPFMSFEYHRRQLEKENKEAMRHKKKYLFDRV